MEVLAFFEWLDTSLLADVSKAYGGVFAVVQMFHLASMAVLGGMVLVGDLHLLGWVMRDLPSATVLNNTRKWFGWALVIMILSGIFMMSAVAIKLYYNQMFWAKMASLAIGIGFFYGVRGPLLALHDQQATPWVIKLTAATSVLIWFTVAACGRWIGFS